MLEALDCVNPWIGHVNCFDKVDFACMQNHDTRINIIVTVAIRFVNVLPVLSVARLSRHCNPFAGASSVLCMDMQESRIMRILEGDVQRSDYACLGESNQHNKHLHADTTCPPPTSLDYIN